MTLKLIFWICVLLVIYTYVGYGLLLYILVRIKRLFVKRKDTPTLSDEELPHLTLMICAYNESSVVAEKMLNCQQLDYPASKLHIMWVTDGTSDNTNDLLRAYKDEHKDTLLEVVFSPERRGKTAALNHGMQSVATDLVAFTDANTMLAPASMRVIAQAFTDATVGCVSGEKRVTSANADDTTGKSEGLYWRYESTLKKLDSELCSTMGAAGELFAIRTSLFEDMPTDTLLDDFILSMRIVKRGYRIAYTDTAYAIEHGSANLTEESKRKQRIAAGGLQSIWRLRSLLLPYPRPMVTFQYISHRVLRWSITPIALVALVPLNVILVVSNGEPIYTITWTCQLLFYLLALIGSRKESGIARTIYYFLFMNYNVFRGMLYLAKKQGGAWEKAKRA